MANSRRILCMLFLLQMTMSRLGAQTDSGAPYLSDPEIPAFRLRNHEGTGWITKADLKPGRPVMVMMFSPDCDHCQEQTRVLTAGIDQLGDLQIVMGTYQPLERVKWFHADFGIGKHPSILIGRDEDFTFGRFYRPKSIPFMAIYDREHRFVKALQGNGDIGRIRSALGL